jgi:predicted RNA binding protein YcfA (HicA-like mRNA interferase family)
LKLPRDITGTELAKALAELGYHVTRQTGSHIRLTTFENGEHHITIPAHDPLKIDTLAAFLRTSRNTLSLLVTNCSNVSFLDFFFLSFSSFQAFKSASSHILIRIKSEPLAPVDFKIANKKQCKRIN